MRMLAPTPERVCVCTRAHAFEGVLACALKCACAHARARTLARTRATPTLRVRTPARPCARPRSRPHPRALTGPAASTTRRRHTRAHGALYEKTYMHEYETQTQPQHNARTSPHLHAHASRGSPPPPPSRDLYLRYQRTRACSESTSADELTNLDFAQVRTHLHPSARQQQPVFPHFSRSIRPAYILPPPLPPCLPASRSPHPVLSPCVPCPRPPSNRTPALPPPLTPLGLLPVLSRHFHFCFP
eukprot:4887300-Pleurochrysis_carterae.AAC.1